MLRGKAAGKQRKGMITLSEADGIAEATAWDGEECAVRKVRRQGIPLQ